MRLWDGESGGGAGEEGKGGGWGGEELAYKQNLILRKELKVTALGI